MAELSGETPDAMAQAISGRLQAMVPEGASPSIPTSNEVLLHKLANRPGVEGELADACESILSDVQDQIIRDLKAGGPRSVDAMSSARDSAKDLPMPEAAVVSGTLRLWYGDARRPALELPPIHLDGLEAGVQ